MTRVAILTFVFVCSVAVQPAHACTCVPALAPCAQFWKVSAVFVGTVRDIQPVEGSPVTKLVSFDVEQAGRGIAGKRVTVEAAVQTGSNCGYTFQLGERYVVYARGSDGRLTTDMCSGTKLVSDAIEDLAFLKEVAGQPRGVRIFGT